MNYHLHNKVKLVFMTISFGAAFIICLGYFLIDYFFISKGFTDTNYIILPITIVLLLSFILSAFFWWMSDD